MNVTQSDRDITMKKRVMFFLAESAVPDSRDGVVSRVQI